MLASKFVCNSGAKIKNEIKIIIQFTIYHDYFQWKVQKPNQAFQGRMQVSMNFFS